MYIKSHYISYSYIGQRISDMTFNAFHLLNCRSSDITADLGSDFSPLLFPLKRSIVAVFENKNSGFGPWPVVSKFQIKEHSSYRSTIKVNLKHITNLNEFDLTTRIK